MDSASLSLPDSWPDFHTKVGVIRQQEVQSPLDVLTGGRPASAAQRAARPVGRMQIELRPRRGEQAADVTLKILSGDRYVQLHGIVVRQPRVGWVTLEVPPLEAWRQPFLWLTPPQRERIESPEFYKLLQEQVGRRYLATSTR